MSASAAYDFPGFYTPYFTLLTFPVAGIIAIATKFFCYRRFSDNQNRPDLTDIAFAICASVLTGVLLIMLIDNIVEMLPVVDSFGQIIGPFISRQNFTVFIIITFPIACFLSITAEFVALRFLTRDDKVENLFQISTIANIIGYILQGITVWSWVAWIW